MVIAVVDVLVVADLLSEREDRRTNVFGENTVFLVQFSSTFSRQPFLPLADYDSVRLT